MSDLERVTLTIPRALVARVDAERGERSRSSTISSIVSEHFGEALQDTLPAIPSHRSGASVDEMIDALLSSPRFLEAIQAASSTPARPRAPGRERAPRGGNVVITDEVRAVLKQFADLPGKPSVREMRARGADVTNLQKWLRGPAKSLPEAVFEEVKRIVDGAGEDAHDRG